MLRRTFMMSGLGLMAALAGGCAGRAEPGMPIRDDTDAGHEELRPAFYFAFPIFEFARVAQASTQAVGDDPGSLNQMRYRARLLDHTNRTVTGPNADTIYTSTFLDLSGGPLDLFVPTERERYFSIAFMNILTDNFAYIGTRATGGEGGRFWIAGPNWIGDTPANARLIRCESNDVWMLSRILVDGPKDLAAASALQRQIELRTPPGRARPKPFQTPIEGDMDARLLLSVVNEMLARSSPGARGEIVRAANFAHQGLGATAAMSPDLLRRWDGIIPVVLEDLRIAFRERRNAYDGWAYQPEGVGDFGRADRLRAAVALGGLAALGEEEAMYFHANTDADGAPLTGENAYRFTVPPQGIPVDAFWSLTMYEAMPDGRYFLVRNPIGRYTIGDRTEGLVTEPDGSIRILIQHKPPSADRIANWLPAPAGPMRLALRTYLPKGAIRQREWKVPPLLRADD